MVFPSFLNWLHSQESGRQIKKNFKSGFQHYRLKTGFFLDEN